VGELFSRAAGEGWECGSSGSGGTGSGGGGSAAGSGGRRRGATAHLSRGSVASAATTVGAAAMTPAQRAWSRATRDESILGALAEADNRVRCVVEAALSDVGGGE
jgi:hypothetical protein